MANPFQRFALGAAPVATPTPPVTRHSIEELLPIGGKKRKRVVKKEPSEEPPTASSSLVKHEHDEQDVNGDAATDESPTEGGLNARRIVLLQGIFDARRDGPDAPIDIYGTQACVFRPATTSQPTQRFQILVAALLSSQTQDPITHGAMQRLHTLLEDDGSTNVEGLTIAKVRATTAQRLEELLVPVGFYRRKAQQLKQVADTLHHNYTSDIPRTLEGLLALPGVGPKIARVILLLAWDEVESGLIVDTHVHRLAQRLGWVGRDGTKTPEQTRAALEEWVPRSYWREFSRVVVGFGQNVCVAVHPKCVECPLAPQCPSAFTYRHPAKQAKKKSKTTVPVPITSVELEYEHDSEDTFEAT